MAERRDRAVSQKLGVWTRYGLIPRPLPPLSREVTGSRDQWKEAASGPPPAQMNLEYLFPREELEELPPHLILALQHLSHTSISYLQDIGEEVGGRTKAQTG